MGTMLSVSWAQRTFTPPKKDDSVDDAVLGTVALVW